MTLFVVTEPLQIECRKTKTKVITLVNHKKSKNNSLLQSKLEEITCGQQEARENVCEQVTIGFGFESGTSFLKDLRHNIVSHCIDGLNRVLGNLNIILC